MSKSPLIRAVEVALERAGYKQMPTPLRVAGVDFEFTSAMRGSDGRALDLVLLVDTTTGDHGDKDAARVRQRIEGLSRALDVTGSRFVVTAVLAGAALSGQIEELSETCRVLQVEPLSVEMDGTPSNEAVERELADSIRVLLPLSLPERMEDASASSPAMERLAKALSNDIDRDLLNLVLDAAEHGEAAVTEAASARVDRELDNPDEALDE